MNRSAGGLHQALADLDALRHARALVEAVREQFRRDGRWIWQRQPSA